MSNSKYTLGGHLGSDAGFPILAAATRGMDYSTVQFMVGPSGRAQQGSLPWYEPFPMTEGEINHARELLYGLRLWVHLPYMLNPCEDDNRKSAFYRRTYRKFCELCVRLGVEGVVIHPGFKKDLSEEQALSNLVRFFEKSHDQANWDLKLLIENDAGSKNGSAVGSLEFIKEAVSRINEPYAKICLDTCHIYARGYDIWQPDLRKKVVEAYGHLIELVHLNVPDNKVSLGSNLDRHNTPFSERVDELAVNHEGLIRDMLALAPCILERSSVHVQELDRDYINLLMES